MAIVLEAVLRIGKRALKNRFMIMIATMAFVAIFFYNVPFPLIVLSAAVLGFLGHRFRPDLLLDSKSKSPVQASCEGSVLDNLLDAHTAEHVRPSFLRSVGVILVWSALWFCPLILIFLTLGSESVYFQQGLFFSKTAVVTFGGAYAVLAYVAQRAVDLYGWLKPGEMLDGLGLAETTPGPLILVLQFVGFLGAYRNPGGLDPIIAGVLGSALTVWVTFVPCFLWIFLGAPYIEALRGNKSLDTAMSSITAAVVGVILNLAVWFALHTLFGSLRDVQFFGAQVHIPVLATVNLPSLGIAIVALLALFRFKIEIMYTLAVCACLGIAFHACRYFMA